jgi:bifunctional non-homologous end joining protein LigD
VACGEDGIACFELLLVRWDADGGVFLYAFDLIELDGDDLRHHPLTVRKTTLASLVARAAPGLQFNAHIEADGLDVFNHACKLGLEGIVSKRKESRYRSGRSPDWLKSKNPNARAVKSGLGKMAQKTFEPMTLDGGPYALSLSAQAQPGEP